MTSNKTSVTILNEFSGLKIPGWLTKEIGLYRSYGSIFMTHLRNGVMKIYLYLIVLVCCYVTNANAVERKGLTDSYVSFEKQVNFLKSEPIHCKKNETILFNCRIGKKILSICGYPKDSQYKSFEYRYGELNKIEMKFNASHENKNRMRVYIEQVNPRATVHYLWFEKNDYGYVITECVGSGCKAEAGLIVFKKNKVVNSKACESNIYGDDENKFYGHAYFNSGILKLGSDFNDSVSKSDLLILDENYSGYEINSLYPENYNPY